MKKLLSFYSLLPCFITISFGQSASVTKYKKTSVMIPVRDGVKLFTVILTPVDVTTANAHSHTKNSIWG